MFPTYKDDEIDVMAQLVTQKEIDAYNKSSGNECHENDGKIFPKV
jgi:hypothetical protein